MDKTIISKMGIKEFSRSYFQNVPDGFIGMMNSLNLDIPEGLSDEFDYIHLFTISEAQLMQSLNELKPHISKHGSLWVSWPKANQLNTNLNLHKIIKIIYQNGLVESKVISIDNIWSAIKITLPKKCEIYKNRFGGLKKDS